MPPEYRRDRPDSRPSGSRTLGLLAVLVALLGAACQRQAHVPAPILNVISPLEEAESAFRRGAYDEAERLYWNLLDPDTPAERERALFRLVLVHALPDSPLRDHDRARGYLDLLEEDFPETEFAVDAVWIRGALGAFEELASRATASAAENARLVGETGRLRLEQQLLESALARVLPLPAESEAAEGNSPEAESADTHQDAAHELEALLEQVRARYPNPEAADRLETVPALRARLEALARTQQEQLVEIRSLTARLAALNAELERLKEIDLRRRPQN